MKQTVMKSCNGDSKQAKDWLELIEGEMLF